MQAYDDIFVNKHQSEERIIITFFWYIIVLIAHKAIFLRQADNIQQENDCQTSDMYNNGTSHVSGPGPFM